MSSSSSSAEHLAVILPQKGSALTVQHRPTPTPGPNDLLISVSSIALNPMDWKMRDWGMIVQNFPTVLGSDIAGTVISAGSSVGSDAPKPGTRVIGFAPCFYTAGIPDYGALQQKVLIPAANVTPIPENLSFNEASILPLAVATTWAGFYRLGVSRKTAHTESDKQGILVWGASSSVGSVVVQTAKLLGFRVYATASKKHHAYVKCLGASRVFDYKSAGVEDNIVKAAREDGVTIRIGYDAVGALKSCIETLKGLNGNATAKLVSADLLPEDLAPVEGVDVQFVHAPEDEKERTEHFQFIFNVWLKEKLATEQIVPSPKVQVLGHLEAASKGFAQLKAGVSGKKLVLEV